MFALSKYSLTIQHFTIGNIGPCQVILALKQNSPKSPKPGLFQSLKAVGRAQAKRPSTWTAAWPPSLPCLWRAPTPSAPRTATSVG